MINGNLGLEVERYSRQAVKPVFFYFIILYFFLKSITLTTTVLRVKCYPLLFSKFLQRQIHKQHHSMADIVHFVDKGELRLSLSLHLFLFPSVSPAVGRMSKVTQCLVLSQRKEALLSEGEMTVILMMQ